MSHLPVRPAWTCLVCAHPWPCSAQRQKLLSQYGGTPISLYQVMAMRMVDAAADLTTVPAGALHDRFLGWVRASTTRPLPQHPATRDADEPLVRLIRPYVSASAIEE